MALPSVFTPVPQPLVAHAAAERDGAVLAAADDLAVPAGREGRAATAWCGIELTAAAGCDGAALAQAAANATGQVAMATATMRRTGDRPDAVRQARRGPGGRRHCGR